MKPDELRKKHPKLIYKSFEIFHKDNDLTISSHFHLEPDISFNPQVTIHSVSQKQLNSLSKKELELFAFHLGLAEIFSYWKSSIPEKIIIEAGSLSDKQLEFWHHLLINGMGEFFYTNLIDFTREKFVEWTSSSDQDNQLSPTEYPDTELSGVLVPQGGGKDSLVTLELLKKNQEKIGEPITLFALNPIHAVEKVVKKNPDLPIITATRVIDPKLLELNENGYLNGHTPFSSYIAFLTLFVARLFGLKYIALSNERSANEESLTYLHQNINHQYSKSYELEKMFQDYVAETFGPTQPFYFSFLRPLYELQIGKLFADNSLYLKEFKSCNVNQRQDSWCGNCSKCLFAYMMLFPFLEYEEITQAFGQNLFENKQLWSLAEELTGYSDQKPLECIGTKEESLVSLYLGYQKVKNSNKRLSYILNKFSEIMLPNEGNLEDRAKQIMTAWNNENSLPEKFDRILKYVQQNSFSV